MTMYQGAWVGVGECERVLGGSRTGWLTHTRHILRTHKCVCLCATQHTTPVLLTHSTQAHAHTHTHTPAAHKHPRAHAHAHAHAHPANTPYTHTQPTHPTYTIPPTGTRTHTHTHPSWQHHQPLLLAPRPCSSWSAFVAHPRHLRPCSTRPPYLDDDVPRGVGGSG